ncbi:MAG: hypothetical protein JWQ18_969 [Conexibacter sp.]|nr:hypothetical protein [Conexibacter sp.]
MNAVQDRTLAQPALAEIWHGLTGTALDAELLEWPPDLLALTDTLLERADAYRFVFSPPAGAQWPPAGAQWPPGPEASWSTEVHAAARAWSLWVEDQRGPLPALLAREWAIVEQHSQTTLEDLAAGREWRLCQALLTLHAIADEACAGLFVALDCSEGTGCIYRARGRELLARTGSLSRIHDQRLRVVPKVCCPPSGRAYFARYACTIDPGLEISWRKLPARHPGTDPRAEHANLLLLPWPLKVRESDFQPVGDIQRLADQPYGHFAFAPSERLDLDLVDQMLRAACDEVGSIDVVVLPECAIEPQDIAGLEAVLSRHGVIYLETGVREAGEHPGDFGRNWIHIGVDARLDKGRSEPSPAEPSAGWFHLRQDKHHRWSLDQSQIYQYHLGGALHPHVRWWEAIEVPRSSLEFIQVGEEITLASLVCEDLAQNDAVSKLIRAVGPTIVLALLLDGPQLTSRWAARYAGVLADDPGSAVLTLSSAGMVARSRPDGRTASPVIGLWKDPVQGTREIPLEPGAQGVVLTLCGERASRRTADGRRPVQSGTRYFDVAVHQVRAAGSAGVLPEVPGRSPACPSPLDVGDLTILTGWAEGVAEALAHAPDRTARLLDAAHPDARWREELGLDQPSRPLTEALDSIAHLIATTTPTGTPWNDVLRATYLDPDDETPLTTLARRVLRSALEQLGTRLALGS